MFTKQEFIDLLHQVLVEYLTLLSKSDEPENAIAAKTNLVVSLQEQLKAIPVLVCETCGSMEGVIIGTYSNECSECYAKQFEID